MKMVRRKTQSIQRKNINTGRGRTKEQQNKIIEKPVEVNIYKTSHILFAAVVGGGIYFGYQIWKTNANRESSGKTKEVKSEPVKPDPFYME